MSRNNNINLPQGAQNQIVRQLRGRSVLVPNQNNNGGGSMGLPLNSQVSSDSFLSAQSVQPHLVHHQSNSGALSMAQANTGLGIDMQGMYNSTQNHALSHGLSFANVNQPVSGFSQQELYSQPNIDPFQVDSSVFDIVPSGLRVLYGYTFKDLKIDFGMPNLADTRQAQIRARKQLELLTTNPPALPENTVEVMQPKQVFPDYIKLADDATKAEKKAAEKINHEIAKASQKVDRERNNEAAKRSRRLKNENLENANKKLVENAFHIAWLEAQLSAIGGQPEVFDTIDANIKQRLYKKITETRDSFYERRKKEKSKRETKKRSEHNKKRAAKKRELNERAARQYAAIDLTEETIEESIEVSADIPVNGAVNVAAAAAPNEDVIIPDSLLVQPGSEQPLRQPEGQNQDQDQGQDQGQTQNDESNDGPSFAIDGDLNESLMLMKDDNEWDPCLS